MDIRWQPIICYHVTDEKQGQREDMTCLRPTANEHQQQGGKTGIWAIDGELHHHIKASRTPHILATLLHDVCPTQAQHTSCGPSRTDVSRTLQEDRKFEQHSVGEALLLGVKTGPVSMKAVSVQIKFNYKYEKNPKWFKQDRCLFLSQIQSHLKVGNPGLLWMCHMSGTWAPFILLHCQEGLPFPRIPYDSRWLLQLQPLQQPPSQQERTELTLSL